MIFDMLLDMMISGKHSNAIRVTFEAVWGERGRTEAFHNLLNRVVRGETKNSIL